MKFINWEKRWITLMAACVLFALAIDARAYDLQKCEWLANQSYSQAWQRDAGVSLVQLKILIRRSDERPEVQTGLVALARYVYLHSEMSPDQLADDLLRTCRSYDQ